MMFDSTGRHWVKSYWWTKGKEIRLCLIWVEQNDMNFNELRNSFACSSMYSGGLLNHPLLSFGDSSAHVDTFAPHTHVIWQRNTHTHTQPPAVFTVSRVEEMPVAKSVAFLFFPSSLCPLSHSLFSCLPPGGILILVHRPNEAKK